MTTPVAAGDGSPELEELRQRLEDAIFAADPPSRDAARELIAQFGEAAARAPRLEPEVMAIQMREWAVLETGVLRTRLIEWADQLARAPRRACIIGEYCHDHGFIHGAEAEELRKRVERILADVDHEGDDAAEALDRALRIMLDEVDARDSLAYLDRVGESAARSPQKLRTL